MSICSISDKCSQEVFASFFCHVDPYVGVLKICKQIKIVAACIGGRKTYATFDREILPHLPICLQMLQMSIKCPTFGRQACNKARGSCIAELSPGEKQLFFNLLALLLKTQCSGYLPVFYAQQHLSTPQLLHTAICSRNSTALKSCS